jgi:DNA-binding MarR family transcriptional regulator
MTMYCYKFILAHIMTTTQAPVSVSDKRYERANRLFFRLYQCANALHKTGSLAVSEEGLTTQQWAVMGALSRFDQGQGMGVGELADYLLVSRQNLAGVIDRLQRAGRIELQADPSDGRAKQVCMTKEGRAVWEKKALPKIANYYEAALTGLSQAERDTMSALLGKVHQNMLSLPSRKFIFWG